MLSKGGSNEALKFTRTLHRRKGEEVKGSIAPPGGGE